MERETIHQIVDHLVRIFSGMGGEMGVFRGGQDATVPEDFLDLQQVEVGLD